jgi:hypothetical protein
MKPLAQFSGLLLLSALVMPTGLAGASESLSPAFTSPSQPLLLARGGGGRGGGGRVGGGGGRHGGGGGAHRAQTGFQSAGGGLNRGDSKPTGGWSNKVNSDRARPSMDRPVATRSINRDGARQINRDGARDLNLNGNREISRNVNRNVNRDINRNWDRQINRNWDRTVDINRVNLYPGWARPGWAVARPWNYGWYGGWSNPPWGWWAARAAVWGVASLATAAVINDAVDDAVDDHLSYIVVPNSNYQLLYGTVSPSGSSGVTFDVTAGGTTYQLSADCNSGTLNGQAPSNTAEAELLNAACQVAYGAA